MNPAESHATVRIVCAQIDPVVGDRQGNRRRAVAAIREAAELGPDLVLLPELANSGYVFESLDEARRLADRAEEGAPAEWAREAAQRVLFGDRRPDVYTRIAR